MTADQLLRVSAAALCRVIFPHPHTGAWMLALERRNTQGKMSGSGMIHAQPFGGALRILDPAALQSAVGDFVYDSRRSREEQDLRILISPEGWTTVRGFIVSQMQVKHSAVLETDPCRELEEEFSESAGISLLPEHYTFRPLAVLVQDRPSPTTSSRSPGTLTTRIYRFFEVKIHHPGICEALLENSRRFTDENLLAIAEADFAKGGRGKANSVLVMPLEELQKALQPAPAGGQTFVFQGHRLDPTVALLFEAQKVGSREDLFQGDPL